MPALFQRQCSLTLIPPMPGTLQAPPVSAQAIVITGLRVQFKIVKSIQRSTPNTAEIQITNLAESTRAKLQAKGTRIILQAGYAGQDRMHRIFSGDSRTIDHVREGPDWVTKIQSGDGERNLRFALVSSSFKPGTPIVTALKEAIKVMAVDPGNSVDRLAAITAQYVSGYAMHGQASVELDSQLRGLGLTYSIQDGKLQILAPGEPTKDSDALINAQAGLIGSPEHGAPEMISLPSIIKAKVLLNGELFPGRAVRIESLYNVAARARIEKMNHEGDTFGGPWYTNIEARPF